MKMNRLQGLMGAGLLGLLALPWSRAGLESTMSGHMLVQIPLLVLAGVLLGGAVSTRWRAVLAPWNRYGLTGLVLALFTLVYWMLPRNLDLALGSGGAELAKFVFLPVLAGLSLRLSWSALGVIGRGVVWSQLVANLAVMGWLYLEAPVRLCTRYLVSDQEAVGRHLLLLALALAVGLATWAFLAVSPTGGDGGRPDRPRAPAPFASPST